MFRKHFGIDRFSETVRTDWDMDSDRGTRQSISLLPGEKLSEEELNRTPTVYKLIIRTSYEKQSSEEELSENGMSLSLKSDELESQPSHMNQISKRDKDIQLCPDNLSEQKSEKKDSDDKGDSKKMVKKNRRDKLRVKVCDNEKPIHRFNFRPYRNRFFILFHEFRGHLKKFPKKQTSNKKIT